MALIVEDGTGKADAESYNSVAEVSSILALTGEGAAFDALAESVQEQLARKVNRAIDTEYLHRGRKKTSTQAAEWPRVGAYDDDGFAYSDTSIPARLKTAHALLCGEAAVTGVDLQPNVDEPGGVESESVRVGPITVSTTYSGAKGQEVFYRKADAMLAELVEDSSVIRRA